MSDAPALEVQAFDLASQFLADIAGRREAWPLLFKEWSARQGLSRDVEREVRVQVLRVRVFGAVHHGGDAA